MDEDDIIDRIVVKPGHGAKVVKVFLTLEKFLDIPFYSVNNFFDSFLIGGLLVSHDITLLSN